VGGPYRTGDVERLLGLGEHVLRYWERELPILSPARSPFGRREWSESDISLLLRVRHLVKDRGFGLSAGLVSSYFESRALAERIASRSLIKNTMEEINARTER
jgi:hypothetical protein